MLFSIQAYIEDYIILRNLRDTDGYAVQVASLYFHNRASLGDPELLRRIRRIRTVFFSNNSIAHRAEFEKLMLKHLDRKFKKNAWVSQEASSLSFSWLLIPQTRLACALAKR